MRSSRMRKILLFIAIIILLAIASVSAVMLFISPVEAEGGTTFDYIRIEPYDSTSTDTYYQVGLDNVVDTSGTLLGDLVVIKVGGHFNGKDDPPLYIDLGDGLEFVSTGSNKLTYTSIASPVSGFTPGTVSFMDYASFSVIGDGSESPAPRSTPSGAYAAIQTDDRTFVRANTGNRIIRPKQLRISVTNPTSPNGSSLCRDGLGNFASGYSTISFSEDGLRNHCNFEVAAICRITEERDSYDYNVNYSLNKGSGSLVKEDAYLTADFTVPNDPMPVPDIKTLTGSDSKQITKTVTFNFNKTDSKTGDSVEGAVFTIYDEITNQVVGTATTNQNGKATYTFNETKTITSATYTESYASNYNDLLPEQQTTTQTQAQAQAKIDAKVAADLVAQETNYKGEKNNYYAMETTTPTGYVVNAGWKYLHDGTIIKHEDNNSRSLPNGGRVDKVELRQFDANNYEVVITFIHGAEQNAPAAANQAPLSVELVNFDSGGISVPSRDAFYAGDTNATYSKTRNSYYGSKKENMMLVYGSACIYPSPKYDDLPIKNFFMNFGTAYPANSLSSNVPPADSISYIGFSPTSSYNTYNIDRLRYTWAYNIPNYKCEWRFLIKKNVLSSGKRYVLLVGQEAQVDAILSDIAESDYETLLSTLESSQINSLIFQAP